jgi:hypothetical protein
MSLAELDQLEQRLTGSVTTIAPMLLEEQVSAEPPVEETTPND